MKFIHLADCHLASPLAFDQSLGSLIREKSWESFANIFAANKDVDFALVAGDLFERTYVSAADFARIFEIFADFGKDIYYVTGNHDYFDAYNQVFLNNKPNNLQIFTKDSLSMFEEGAVRVYGISYMDRINSYDFPYSIKLDPNFFNILLAHADIFPNPTSYLDLDPEKLGQTGFSYVALGHIHKRGKVGNCYYPGSIEPFNHLQTGNFGYIRYEDGQVLEVDSSLIKFTNFDLDTRDFSSVDELIAFVNRRLTDKINILNISLANEDGFDIRKIKAGIGTDFIEIKETKSQDLAKFVELYPDSLLAKFNDRLATRDDEIGQRARKLGLDAILRTRQ